MGSQISCTQHLHVSHSIHSISDVSWSTPGGISLKQNAQTWTSMSSNSFAVASDNLPFSCCTFLFFLVEKKRFCFSYSLFAGNNFVFKYWWSDPITVNPLATDIADLICHNVVFMVSFVGAFWIKSVNSAICLSAWVLRSDSCLLSWSFLSCWMRLDKSWRFFSMSVSLVVSRTTSPSESAMVCG